MWEIRAGVQVSRREFHTHIHLDYVIAEIISYIYIYVCVCVCVCGPILPCVQTVCEEGPGPISSVRANEYPRTTSRGMDKITIRGEVEYACDELGRVRGGWSPRDFCPR